MGDPDQSSTDVPHEDQAFLLSPTPAPKASLKHNLTANLPHFAHLDADTVRIDPRTEKYLRESGINNVYAPSTGVLTEKSLLELVLQEPVHVIRRNGDWWCVAGEASLSEAKRILTPPRFLPVLVRQDSGKDTLQTIVAVGQMIRPARNQMDNAALRALVPRLLCRAETMPSLFAQRLRDDQWANILSRSLRWFAAAKKRTPNKNGGPDGN